jgi:multidrug efflux pump subunit AcrA (membrane-fusion protein)
MRFGPTSLRLSGVEAKGLRRPKLRTDLKVGKQTFAGETSFVVKVPETDSFSRLGDLDWELLSLCDGTRTPGEVAQALNERYSDQNLSGQEVIEYLDGVDPNFWERGAAQKNLCILEKIRDERRERVNHASLLYIYFSAFDPDRALERLDRYLGWMFTKQFVLFSLGLFALAGVIVAHDYRRISQEALAVYGFQQRSGYDLLVMWIMLFIIVGPHEFAHGLACKHFGGEVHHMGFMLLYFSPSFYTDCTDMHVFEKTSQRIWTIIAGIWVTLLQSCLALFFWALAPPGSLASNLAYKFALLSGVIGFFQLNPLLKIDGYYVLSQYLQIDNLREQSFAYTVAWLRHNVPRQPIELPPASLRERRIFLGYGFSAGLYSVLIIFFFMGFVDNAFTGWLGDWGHLATLAVLCFALRKRLQQWSTALGRHFRKLKEEFMAWRMRWWQPVAGGAALLVLFLPPTAVKTTADFLLEPQRRLEVKTPVAGLVQTVTVREGETVPAGSVLAVLHNPEIEAQAKVLASQLRLAENSQRAALARSDFRASEEYGQEIQRLETEKAVVDRKREQLVLRAPFAGEIATPQVEQRVGEYLNEGEPLALLVDRQAMRARVLVRDWELEDVHQGAVVGLKLRSYPLQTFSGMVRQIMPAASPERPLAEPNKVERKGQELTNFFEVVLEFPNPKGELKDGMTGTARIHGRRYPVALRAVRAGWRWARGLVW